MDSPLIAARSWHFSDIQPGDVFWLATNSVNTHHCKAQFGHMSSDGKSRQFDCINGAWKGTLTELEEGFLELYVHFTKSRILVYLSEKVEPIAQTNDEVAL